MITMLLGGLWHGANWTFVVWGALHGFYLWVEKMFQDRKKPALASIDPGVVSIQPVQNKTLRNFLLALLTFFLVNVTWVFFRATDFTSAWRILSSMFFFAHDGHVLLSTLSMIKIAFIITGVIIFHWLMRNTKVLTVAEKMPWWLLGIIWSVLLILLILSQESSSAFIYFQF